MFSFLLKVYFKRWSHGPIKWLGVKAYVVKPAVLNLISGIHMVEGRNGIYPHTQTKINLILKKLKLGCVLRNCQKQIILWDHENNTKS